VTKPKAEKKKAGGHDGHGEFEFGEIFVH